MAVFIGDPDTHRLAPPLVFFWVLVIFVSAVLGGGCVWLYLLVTLALADEDPSWPNLPSNTNKTACTLVQNVEH